MDSHQWKERKMKYLIIMMLMFFSSTAQACISSPEEKAKELANAQKEYDLNSDGYVTFEEFNKRYKKFDAKYDGVTSEDVILNRWNSFSNGQARVDASQLANLVASKRCGGF